MGTVVGAAGRVTSKKPPTKRSNSPSATARASRFAQTHPAKIARLPSTGPRKRTHRGCCRRSRRAHRAAAGRRAAGTATSARPLGRRRRNRPENAHAPRPPGSRTVWGRRRRGGGRRGGQEGDVTSSSGAGGGDINGGVGEEEGRWQRGGQLRAGGFVFSEVFGGLDVWFV